MSELDRDHGQPVRPQYEPEVEHSGAAPEDAHSQYSARPQASRVNRPETTHAYQPEPEWHQEDPRSYPPHQHDQPQQDTPQGATFIHILGAVTSLALVVGLGVWGYKLAVRDVSGLPIVKALDGPSRVQPDDPGGQLASNQGLSVNAVQAEGEAEPAAERLQLAPKPVDVLPSDNAGATAPATVAVPQARLAENADQVAPSVAPEGVTSGEESVAIDVATSANDRLDAEAAVMSTDNDEVAALEEDANPDRLAPSVPGLAVSARPSARPAGFDNLVSEQRATAAAVEAALAEAVNAPEGVVVPQSGDFVREIDPDTIPVGTNLVQLGAFASIEIAKAEWSRISLRHQDFMAGKDRVIQAASSGGREFFRLRAHGFTDVNDARRFCVALKAENTDCVPLVTR